MTDLHKAHVEAEREALAMALHVTRPDKKSIESLSVLFNESKNPGLVIYHLALLPSKLMTGYATGLGEQFNFETYIKKTQLHKPTRLDGGDE